MNISAFAAIEWDPNPTLIEFWEGGPKIAWYGVMFVLGFFIGLRIVESYFKREGRNVSLLDSLLVYIMAGTVIGARLGHCLFYEWDRYKNDLLSILKVWEGGLASHGGALGVILALLLFCRKHNLCFYEIFDRILIPAALVGAFIRCGNFINSEIIGTPTDAAWGVVFKKRINDLGLEPRHPAMLYEALAYLLLFIFLFVLFRKKSEQLKVGRISGIFLLWVFTARFFIEFVKIHQAAFMRDESLRMGQWLSLPMIAWGIYLLFRKSTPAKIPALASREGKPEVAAE